MADMMCPDTFYTLDEIVDMVMAQKPEDAIEVWDNPDEARKLCLTCIITRYRDNDGTEYDFGEKKHNSVNVRVSTYLQKEGSRGGNKLDDGGIGWRDQIMMAVSLAIQNSKITKCPIRVYNDAGFSGTYPPDDQKMIKEMRETRAETYRAPFQEVVVDRIEDLRVKGDVQKWLDHHVKVLLGIAEATEDDQHDPKVNKALLPRPDRSFAEVEAKLILRYNCHRGTKEFRPGLHFLLEDLPVTNAIFTYDVDRLSRDYALSEVLSTRLAAAVLDVYTCTSGMAGYVRGQTWTDRMMRVAILGQAAEFVRKNMKQILRSHFATLSAGRPVGGIPIWMQRDKNKKITWKLEYLPLVETALRTWMDTQNYKGFRQISTAVNAVMRQINAGIEDPEERLKPQRSESGVFVEATIRYWLTSPMIYGCIQQWGRSWPLAAGTRVDAYRSPLLQPDEGEVVSPLAMISPKQWERSVRARIKVHPKKRGRQTTKKRALSGLLKCRCGAALNFHDRTYSINKRDEWVCHTQPDQKQVILERTGLKWHINIGNDQMMSVINGIMTETPGLLRPTQEPEAELDARYQRMVTERNEIRQDAADKARTILPDADDTSTAFQGVVTSLMKALGLDGVEAQVKRMEEEKFSRLPEGGPPTPEEEAQFVDLSPSRQNEILSSLIKEIRPVQPNGPANLRDEYIQIVKRDGTVLDPIPCIQSRILSTGIPKYRIATYEEWVASWTSSPTETEAVAESGRV
jgi:hypothetical protein